MSQQLRCALVTMAPFPKGNVSTIRYTSYMRALIRDGAYGLVLIYCPTRMAAHIKERKGVSNGIEYQYATRITWGRYYNIFVKIWYLLIGLFSSVKYIRKANINTLILYGENFAIVNLFYWLVCKAFHIRYFADRSEYPNSRIRQSKLKTYCFAHLMSLFDGMIIMTKELVQYYKKCSDKQNFTFLLPMTIDGDRFEMAAKKDSPHPYIAVVFGTHNRDGVYESILAYIKYCKCYSGEFHLALIGDFEKLPNSSTLKSVIEDSGIGNRIDILGAVDTDAVPTLLKNASCLLTTPNGYVSGGFPTKLGEYMLSSVPIVATNVGELSDYIENNKEILFAPKGDIDIIAQKLLYVERHPEEMRNIAKNAKAKALSVFSADTYALGLKEFLQSNH